VLKHVQGELPAWITDSEAERAEWINSILQKLWPFISGGVENMVKEKIQPMLDKKANAMVPSLKFTRVSLGTEAPRLVSVRSYSAKDVACVRMDMELKWASNMEVIIAQCCHQRV
jgi:Ca2+-dependent lipid-binding protein